MSTTNKYAEKWKHPRWQKKRLEIFERDNWTCQSCLSTDDTLAVHHKVYLSGHDPWDYPGELLVTLCETCHELEHGDRPQIEALILDTLKRRLLFGDLCNFECVLSQCESIEDMILGKETHSKG